MTVLEMAKIIFEQARQEGLEEINFDTPWENASDTTKSIYIRIARVVCNKILPFESNL